MGKPKARSILYRLIEAGQLGRRALLVPLVERGLEPGDDAILFLLHEQPDSTEPDVAVALGLDAEAARARIARLVERDLIVCRPADGTDAPFLALTPRGERIRQVLAENWDGLEEALLGSLGKKERKMLRNTLGHFADYLRR